MSVQTPTDAAGYLLDWESWTESFAADTAIALDISMTPDHWQVIHYLRGYYAQFAISPPMRVLVKSIAPLMGDARASSRRLYQLFPDGPAKQACKIAGLPKPDSCI